MIRAILRAHSGLIPAGLLAALLLGSAAWWLASRRGHARLSAVLFGVSLAAELTATFYPVAPGSATSPVCSYSKDVLGAFADQQGLMNLALYLPTALFGTLLAGRSLLVLAGCWLLSATTETAQALLPEIGRACDSQDVVTNAAGALLGVGLATAWRGLRGSLAAPSPREVFWSSMPLSAGAVALFFVQLSTVSPQWADGGLTTLGASQKRALAVKDAHLVFGPEAEIVNVQDEAALGQTPELLIVTTRTGQLDIEWPSGQLYGSGATAPGLPPAGGSDAEARTAADSFARQWYAQSLAASTTEQVRKVDPTKGRRTVEYRRYRSDGLLEPLRLDIEVDPGGRIAAFRSRTVPDPPLAPVTVPRETAVTTATHAHPGTPRSTFLLAAQVGRDWRPCWAVTITPPNAPTTPPVSYEVDAATGALLPGLATR
ncbi:hypothetical protein GCM10009760_50320 [Kitasatospora kazusensis]|uniref:VanZ-like domain-containing protein n=1 Tax=Kitasatospora kazusensis TaxID=407974 RepID=A0ABN3A3D7_9ACTN